MAPLKECCEMQDLTAQYVNKLTAIWEDIFDQKTCHENLRKLLLHTTEYFEDLVSESLEKKEYIEKEIQNLREEAETLRRLLKTDVQFSYPMVQNAPLLVIQSEMDKSLTELREILRQRREQIYELLMEQDALCDELAEPPLPLLSDPLPDEAQIEEFRSHLFRLKEERVKRTTTISQLRREIKHFLHMLELYVDTDTDYQLLCQREIKLSQDTVGKLKQMHHRYELQGQQLQEEVDGMRRKLETLWNRLDTSPTSRRKFDRYSEYNKYNRDFIYNELQRCEEEKRKNIQKYVEQIREEIVHLWDKTLKSGSERNQFHHFRNNCYTDDLLTLHELELNDLQEFYEKNRQIFDLFIDRKILWDRMNALEIKATEPGRYTNRGGQLLREEKERKTIATKLPKIEQQITEHVQVYEQRERKPFLVYGESILEVMANEWEKKRQEKELKSSARKQAQGTPQPPSRSRTPMSVRSASTFSLHKASSTTSLASIHVPSSQKRKLNPAEKNTPAAKRSLLHALNSSSSTKKEVFKTPLKKTVVIGTTIRRKSGRLSGSGKNRLTIKKNQKNTLPKVRINNITCSESSDDKYTSFEKDIEYDSRSSVIQRDQGMSKQPKRRFRPTLRENTHLVQQSEKRALTPLKPTRIPAQLPNKENRSPTHLSPKNLPILI